MTKAKRRHHGFRMTGGRRCWQSLGAALRNDSRFMTLASPYRLLRADGEELLRRQPELQRGTAGASKLLEWDKTMGGDALFWARWLPGPVSSLDAIFGALRPMFRDDQRPNSCLWMELFAPLFRFAPRQLNSALRARPRGSRCRAQAMGS